MLGRYVDLDLDFKPHPITGDLSRKFDGEAVKRSIRALILTQTYERPFQPGLGVGIYGLLFEPLSPVVAVSMRNMIVTVIRRYEPRANLVDVRVNSAPDQNSYDVTITFRLTDNPNPLTLVLALKRLR